MTTPLPRPKRRRRFASDEAHAFARNLRLKNPLAKSVARAIAMYCNDEGSCIAGLSTLAEDCDVSVDTVRSRLKFLEDVGAIARFPRWVDDAGRANTEGRGKRTTDDIRLLIDADVETIEARAAGEPVDDDDGADGVAETEFSPGQQQGLNQPPETVSPRPALGQPLHSSQGLISEPEPEDSPQPPLGGRSLDDLEGEAKYLFEGLRGDYPDAARWAWLKVLPIFAGLRLVDQQRARAAAPAYAAQLAAARPKAAPVRPERFLKDRIFDNFPHAPLPEKPPPRVWIVNGSADWLALEVLAITLDHAAPRPIRNDAGEYGMWRIGAVNPDLSALARFHGSDPLDWPVAEPETREFNAWRSRLHEWTGRWHEPRIVMRRGTTIKEVSGKPMSFQNRIKGLLVPCRWPPKKDGTIYPDHSDSITKPEGNDHA